MRVLLILVTLLGVSVRPAMSQSLGDLVAAINAGGGWVSIDIEDGRGSLRTAPVPTVGLVVNACMQVWGGHSGRWEIEAEDLRGEGRMSFRGEPGTPHPLEYRTGMTTQLDVSVRWSEPRDTTLLLWVGLRPPGGGRDPCEPAYGGGR